MTDKKLKENIFFILTSYLFRICSLLVRRIININAEKVNII